MIAGKLFGCKRDFQERKDCEKKSGGCPLYSDERDHVDILSRTKAKVSSHGTGIDRLGSCGLPRHHRLS